MRFLLPLALLGALAAAYFWYRSRDGEAKPAYRTAEVRRGDLVVTVGATGTVEPEDLVDVGAQVAGQILRFGQDESGQMIDYGSAVEEGTVLAEIDDSLYAADVADASATLQQDRAGVGRAEADLGQLKSKLVLAERDWERAQQLGPDDVLSKSSRDSYQSAYEVAKANVAVGDAALEQAKAAVAGAEASLARAQRNLGYCTIRSPVGGVIIDRRVNVGQTVVSSLNAPSLFLIAKDLKRIQVWVAVSEADIGSIVPGMPVRFTVDAFPGQDFQGQVGKVRLNATMTQNVVTYTVEVETDNDDAKLLPYLTANAEFEVRHDRDVLLVPNAALRWTPEPTRVLPGSEMPGSEMRGAKPDAGAERAEPSGRVWVEEGRYVRPIAVRIGPSDGTDTEVESESLSAGQQLLIGERTAESRPSGGGGTPFTPQPFRRSGGS